MGLRIWHQSSTILGELPAYTAALRSHIARAVRPDTEVTLHGKIRGTHTTGYPGDDTRHCALYLLHGLQWITAARKAERQGYDAIVLANLLSPTITEIRTIVEIPVIGYGETAFHLSGLYGRRIGILLFNTGLNDIVTEVVRQSGVSERFVGLAPAGVTFRDVANALAHPDRRRAVIDAIVASGTKLSEECGADVIIPGEAPMALLLGIEGVNYMGDAAVIDGIAASFKMAETLVDLKRTSGMCPSRRGFFHSRPGAERVDAVLKFYGVDALGSRLQED